jgi:hypothetical protein
MTHNTSKWVQRLLFLAIVIIAVPQALMAQFTIVTGTVRDVNGLAYDCGTISASLVTPGGAAPTLNGVSFTGSMSPIGLGCSQQGGTGVPGSFIARLADNNVVLPSGTQWKFQVNITGIQPPIGTGPQTCIATLTITGATQSVSASFSACPALSNITAGGAPSFSAVTAGTNTSALLIGAGGSLGTTGGGVINATPGGSTTQFQYNNAGVLAGTPNFTLVAGVPTVNAGNGIQLQGNIGQIAGGPQANFFSNDVVLSAGGGQFITITANALKWTNEVNAPSGLAGGHFLFPDNVTHTLEINSNNNGTSAFTGAWSCVNITPVTTSGGAVTTDQNMLACTIPAAALNRVGRSLRIHTAGTYSTAAASSSAMTIEAKLCTVSGCGSGTVVDLCDITSSALGAITIANNTWTLDCLASTQTAGASSVYERSGNFTIDLGVLNTAPDSVFLDPNATAVTAPVIDDTAQLFLQITGAFSAASASNIFIGRQLIAETIN